MPDKKPVIAVLFDKDYSNSELNSPLVSVYNMTVFERTVRALLSINIDRILIVGDNNQSQFENIIEERGLSDGSLEFLPLSEVKEHLVSNHGLLVFSEPLLVTPRYINETIEASIEPKDIVADPNKHMAYIHPEGVESLIDKIEPNLDNLVKEAHSLGFKIRTTESIGRYVCEPIPDKKSFENAKGRLIRSLRQPSDEFISRTFNRPISLMITSVIGYTPVTANQFTIFTGIMGLITAYILSLGGDQNFLIGGIMFHFLAVLDAGDGEIARLKFLASERGQWIDTIVDNITYVATLGGLIVGVLRSDPNDFVIYAGIAGVVFVILALLSLYIYLLRYNKGGSLVNIDYSFKSDSGFYGQLMNVLQELGRRPFFSIVFMFLGIFGIMEYSLVYVSLMTFFVFAFSLQAHFQANKK